MTAEASSPRVVLDPRGAGFEAARKGTLLKALLDEGYPVTIGGGDVAPLDRSNLLVLRDDEAGAVEDTVEPTAEVTIRRRGVGGLEAKEVVDLVRGESAGQTKPGTWKPWFPVIDYDRCTNCMQCLSFCLFGVYDVDEDKKIDVAEPTRCKTNCPACSRVCPEVAILFPKYKNGPINGDEVQAKDVEREKMKTDISSLLGGDIYAMLRERHERASSRFSKERDDERALKERNRCLTKLQEQFDIPDDVLQALPSAEAIQAKAAERIAQRSEHAPDDSAANAEPDSVPDAATDSDPGAEPS